MSKRLVARVGSYTKDGQEKGEYCNLGVILSNENGEYGLLDPTVNLAGVLMKQNILAQKDGKPLREKIAFSIYENDNQSGGYNQQAQQAQQPQPVAQQRPQQGINPPAFNPNAGMSVSGEDVPF